MNCAQNKGFSLVEMIISLGIFSTMLVVVMQAMTSANSYSDLDRGQTDLEIASQNLRNDIEGDFANSAWFFRYDPVTMKAYIDPTTRLPVSLYPGVNTTSFSTIEFLKLRTSNYISSSSSPKDEHFAQIRFDDPAQAAIPFSNYANAVPTCMLIFNDSYVGNDQMYVAPVWESSRSGLRFAENQDPNLLRHYRYVLKPTPNFPNISQLWREYVNGADPSTIPNTTATWIPDKMLAEGVMAANGQPAVRFESAMQLDTRAGRIPPTLNQNQIIHIQVNLVRAVNLRETPGMNNVATVSKLVDLTIAMRSISQE